MPVSRYRSRRRPFRRALSSFRRRKTVRSRGRSLGRKRSFIRRRPRFGKSVSRRIRRRGRFALSRAGGRRRIYRAKPDGRINVLHKYKAPASRPRHISTKWKRKVAEALGNQIQLTDVYNFEMSGAVGVTAWGQLSVGAASQIKDAAKHIYNNYKGYYQPEPQAFDSASTAKLKYKLEKLSTTALFVNESTCKVHVHVYECLPRRDIHGDLNTWSPFSIVTTDLRAGDLFDDRVVNGLTPVQMPYTDPRYSPFQVPNLVQNYKIVNQRAFTVHAGGKFTLTLANNNLDVTQYTDWQDGTLTAKKGKYKVLLFKVFGELGIATTAAEAAKSIRNMPFSVICKNWIDIRGRASYEDRAVFSDFHVSRNQTSGFTGGTHVVEEEPQDFADVVDKTVTTNE